MVSQAPVPNTEQPSNVSKTREASELLCDIPQPALGTPQCPAADGDPGDEALM